MKASHKFIDWISFTDIFSSKIRNLKRFSFWEGASIQKETVKTVPWKLAAVLCQSLSHIFFSGFEIGKLGQVNPILREVPVNKMHVQPEFYQ